MSLSSHQMKSDFIFFPVKLQIDPIPSYLRVLAITAENWLQGRKTKIISFDVTEIQTFSLIPTIMKIIFCIHFIVFWELL